MMADRAFCASTPLVHYNTFSLVISVFSCIFMSSQIISSNMSVAFRP